MSRRILHRTVHKRTALRTLTSVGFGGLLVAGLITATPAEAAPSVGCESIRWGFLGSQVRTICDGPKRADGSWDREHRIWTPAGYVPRSTYCGTYSCSSSGGYYRQESTQGYERYVVFDHNVLPDEPGWLPTGSVVIR